MGIRAVLPAVEKHIHEMLPEYDLYVRVMNPSFGCMSCPPIKPKARLRCEADPQKVLLLCGAEGCLERKAGETRGDPSDLAGERVCRHEADQMVGASQ